MSEDWSPILAGETAARATAAIRTVAEAIGKAPLPDRSGAWLAGGEAGVALLFEYLDRAFPDEGYAETALLRIERAIDRLGESTQIPSLYSGFTGIAWVAEHLQGGSADDEDDLNADIDAALLRHLGQTPWDQHFDLTTGLTGFGVYALERLPRPAAVACLERIVERLAETAREHPGGLAWHTPVALLHPTSVPYYPQGYDNLGVAHGTPGVIAVLARICAAGIAVERARPLLAGAVSWLLAQKLPEGEISVYPYSVGPEVRIRPGRTAWCYGDPGIAVALLAAARAAGEPAWEAEALALAHTVARRPLKSCGVNDAGVCHGTAGIGHLFNRLYQATGDRELLAAARTWFERTLGYWEPGRGIGGFLAYTPPDDDFDRLQWNEDAGFLTGSAGMALALLAAASDVEPDWDRILLASL